MPDTTSSLDQRVRAVADQLLLELGSLDAVGLSDVIQRAGGRRQNVAKALNQWRADRVTLGAQMPDGAMRAAYKFARDMWLIMALSHSRNAQSQLLANDLTASAVRADASAEPKSPRGRAS
jgi:hypothetical protein